MLIDISPTISSRIAVWPGDTPFSQRYLCKIATGSNLDLSTIETTVHLGAHADAPSHYVGDGVGIAQRELDFYYGEAQVLHVQPQRKPRLMPDDIREKITAKRVLFSTGSFPDPEHWNEDFDTLSPELIDFLADQGVCLVGIDTPSIDPFHSKALESHKAVARRGMAILEGLILTHVPPAIYTLMAFPLKIEDADAAPVRAVLKKIN